jgi:dTDP-4-dehydrorhamnose reductase
MVLASVGENLYPLATWVGVGIEVAMKIVVTGATGFLGREVVLSALRRGHQVIALGGTRLPTIDGARQALALDLTDEVKLEALILEEFPQAIINCAALATIDACAQNPLLADKINHLLPRQLAQLAFHLGGKVIHFSTDMVFDGEAGRYQHTDVPSPLHLYGKTKAAGEIEVLKYGREHAAVIRTTLINGNSPKGDRGLHERLFRDWVAGRPTSLFTDEIRQPVALSNLADVAVELCERSNLSGVYHWAGADALSRHQMGVRIAEHFGLDTDNLIVASLRSTAPNLGTRPRDLSLQLHPLAGKLKTPVQAFDAQLGELRVPRGCEDWYERETGRKVVRLIEKGIDY